MQKHSQNQNKNLQNSNDIFRIGEGYDVHRFSKGRPFILGGVTIPYEYGLLGHSDADALIHAISDALLGAAALGDLGQHFSDQDPQYKDIASTHLLAQVAQLLEREDYKISNLDATIICQRPKLATFIPDMKKNIATILQINESQVSVKASTEEGLGFTGDLSGLAVRAVALITKTIS